MMWKVYVHNMNSGKIEVYNVFNHTLFLKEIKTAFKKCNSKEDFAKDLRDSLMYYFWSKSEWEVIVSPWCGGRNDTQLKIDVYTQVYNNWDIFLHYTWNCLSKTI